MYKLFKKPLLYLAGVGIGLGILSGVYAEKADEPVANFIAAPSTAPFKVVHHTVKGTVDGIIKGNKKIPIIGTIFGVSGFFKGLGYGAIDSAENVGKGFFGEKISIPEDYGDISLAIDESPVGRIAISTAVSAGVGSWLGATESINVTHDVLSAGEGAAFVGGITGATSSLEETVRNWDDLRLR